METKLQKHMRELREQDRKNEAERIAQLRARQNARPAAISAPYGNSSSYTPASDTCSAPFVPAADSYRPPSADPAPSCDSGGGSFDGGGASGDY